MAGIGSSTLAVILVAIIIIGSIAYISMNRGNEQSSQGAPPGNEEQESSPPENETTTTPGTSQTQTQERLGYTIWDFEEPGDYVTLLPEKPGERIHWPAMYGQRFYAISHIEGYYNFSVNNETSYTIHFTMDLIPNQTYEAACADWNNTIKWTETLDNVFLLIFKFNLSDGTWAQYKMYIYNETFLLYHADLPYLLDQPGLPDPSATIQGVVGAEARTPSGWFTWSSILGKNPHDPDLAMSCNTYYRHQNDPETSLLQSQVWQWISDTIGYVPLFNLLPYEIFDTGFLHGLDQVSGQKVMDNVPTGSSLYDSIYAVLSYEGIGSLPGEGVPVKYYRIVFHVNPQILDGYYVITNSTIIPIQYKVNYHTDSETISSEFHVVDMRIMWNWSQSISEYS